VLFDVSNLSVPDTERLAGRSLELVSQGNPGGDGPIVLFTRDLTRARERLPRFLDYREVEFRSDEASLRRVERFGPVAREILDGLTAGEAGGPRFRFVVGHFDIVRRGDGERRSKRGLPDP
jgi:hypothetical protein